MRNDMREISGSIYDTIGHFWLRFKSQHLRCAIRENRNGHKWQEYRDVIWFLAQGLRNYHDLLYYTICHFIWLGNSSWWDKS